MSLRVPVCCSGYTNNVKFYPGLTLSTLTRLFGGLGGGVVTGNLWNFERLSSFKVVAGCLDSAVEAMGGFLMTNFQCLYL